MKHLILILIKNKNKNISHNTKRKFHTTNELTIKVVLNLVKC